MANLITKPKGAVAAVSTAVPNVREMRTYLPKGSRETSTAVGLGLFLNLALLYTAAFVAVAALPGWTAKALLGIISGSLTSILFVVGHDACHGSLTPKSWLNKLLGRLSFLPALHPFTAWDYGHNSLHHSYTNLRGRDPGYPPFSKADYDALPRWRRRLERVYRSPLGLGLLYFLETWIKMQIFPNAVHRAKMRTPASFQADRLLVSVFLITQVVGLLLLAHRFDPGSLASPAAALALVFCGIVLPYLVWNWLMGFVTFQHHTHPRTRWYADEKEWSFYKGQVASTVHVKFPRLLELALHNIMEHTAHHVDPKVPLYNLRSCQAGLESAYPEAIIVQVWDLRGFFDTMLRCRLYDYEDHRWLDFDGTPTT